MEQRPKIHGVVFSDLGQASKFMGLDWVQKLLSEELGFAPYPATLNVRPSGDEDRAAWRSLRSDERWSTDMPGHAGSCDARIFRVEIKKETDTDGPGMAGAVLLPAVRDYPENKIEIVAPVRLKEAFGIDDGDSILLEFVN